MATKGEMQENLGMFHDYDIYVPTKTIFLTGEITEEKKDRFIKNLHILDSTSGRITVKLSSEGGCVVEGLAIYDAIRYCKNYVRVIGIGEVASMATIILQAGDERMLYRNSYLMIHEGESGTKGRRGDRKAWDGLLNHLEKVSTDIYLDKIKQKKPRFDLKKLDKLMEYDRIMLPKEALDFGLADTIIEESY